MSMHNICQFMGWDDPRAIVKITGGLAGIVNSCSRYTGH